MLSLLSPWLGRVRPWLPSAVNEWLISTGVDAPVTRDSFDPGVRKQAAYPYLKGDGIEIGALHVPLPVPRKAKVRYVDRMSAPELRAHYPELAKLKLVDPDIIDDGESLKTLAPQSQDFVIANHFIEHCEDPILTFKNLFRVLKAGGILYLAIPDKRYTFDAQRPVTPLAHLIADHAKGPEHSRLDHFREWARRVDKKEGEAVETHAQALLQKRYSIHFHVWTPSDFVDLLSYLRQTEGFPFEIVELRENGFEFITILRKTVP